MNDCRAACCCQLGPPIRTLIELLQKHAAQTKVDGGVWQIPHGDEFYEFLIHQFTTTDMTPADVHALGLEQVAKVHAQIEEVMHRIGFQGSLREFMEKTRSRSSVLQ